MHQDADNNIKLGQFCGALSHDAWLILNRIGREMPQIPQHGRIYWSTIPFESSVSGYQTSDLILIQSGFGALYADMGNGSDICCSFIRPGSVIGSWYMFGNRQHPFSKHSYVEILQPMSGCMMPIKALEDAFHECPNLAKVIHESASRDTLDMVTHMTNMATFDSVQKVRYLCQILHDNHIDLNLFTHETIAQILNLNRVTVTKALKIVLSEGF